jgi:hypothetical protein
MLCFLETLKTLFKFAFGWVCFDCDAYSGGNKDLCDRGDVKDVFPVSRGLLRNRIIGCNYRPDLVL